jgi:hypothetical protein
MRPHYGYCESRFINWKAEYGLKVILEGSCRIF